MELHKFYFFQSELTVRTFYITKCTSLWLSLWGINEFENVVMFILTSPQTKKAAAPRQILWAVPNPATDSAFSSAW